MPRHARPGGSVYLDRESGAWRGSITVGGIRTRVRAATKAEAEEKLTQIAARAQAERTQVSGESMPGATWHEATAHWILTAGHAPSTVAGYRKLAKRLSENFPWWHRPVSAVTTREMQESLDRLTTKSGLPVSDSSRRAALALIRGAADVAMRHPEFGLLVNPALGLRLRQIDGAATHPRETLDRSEVARILQRVEVLEPARRLRWLLGFHLGVRALEALALTVEDVTLGSEEHRLSVGATITRLGSRSSGPIVWVRRDVASQRRTLVIPAASDVGVTLASVTAAARAAAAMPLGAEGEATRHERSVAVATAVRAGVGGDGTLTLPRTWLIPHPDSPCLPLPDDRDRADWQALLRECDVPARPRTAMVHAAAERLLLDGGDDVGTAYVLGYATVARLIEAFPNIAAMRGAQVLRRTVVVPAEDGPPLA